MTGPDLPELESLELRPDGEPGRPLVLLPLDEWTHAPVERIAAAAARVAGALPLVVGLAERRPPARLAPLLDALTLTLAPDTEPEPRRQIVPVAHPHLAVDLLDDATRRAPRASVALGRLLRQTEKLDASGGLAAEAAVYSMLLGGPEFGAWLARRGAPRPPAPHAGPLVLAGREGGTLSITLARPERRNAMSAALREELYEALTVADLDRTIRRVELAGAGPSFCAGGDLDEFGTATDLVAAYLVRLERAPWRLLERLRARVTVHLHGAVIGAGLEMSAFAGRVEAEPGTYLALPEIGMGLVPGAGGTVSVVRRAGRWRAAWAMLSGERLDAATALSWGLVDRVAVPC